MPCTGMAVVAVLELEILFPPSGDGGRSATDTDMTHNDSEQYGAVFVLRISVANDPRIVTRFETYLFDASTTDDAYRQATEFSPSLDYRYRNSDGEIVTIKCLGLHELDRVEPDGEDYPGLVSSAEFLTNGIDASALVPERNCLSCFSRGDNRTNFPNLNQ